MLTINFNLENDYELLYLIENYNEEALTALFDKYHNLIVSLISKYKFNKDNYDDIYQEARMVLFKAIQTFNTMYSKSFTMYFKLLLENRFNSLIVREYNKSVVEIKKDETMFINNEQKCSEFVDIKCLSIIEKAVYFQYFFRGNSIEDVSKNLNLTKKQAYNTIFRIKKKLKKQKNK